MIQEKPPTKHT